MDPRADEELARAQAGQRASWLGKRLRGLSWRGRWILCGVGYRLVALGAWLEGILPAEGDASDSPTG